MNIFFLILNLSLFPSDKLKKNQECTLKEREKFHMCA